MIFRRTVGLEFGMLEIDAFRDIVVILQILTSRWLSAGNQAVKGTP